MYVIALLDSWELNLECMLEARAAGGSVTCSLVFFPSMLCFFENERGSSHLYISKQAEA